MFGLVFGVWVTRIPAVKQRLHLSDGTLGVALFATSAGLIVVTLVAGRLVDRFGSARVTRLASVATSLLLVAPAVAGDLGSFMAALFALGVAGGALDVGMNAHGVRVERAYGRPLMTTLHAYYSLGSLAGAVFGGAFAGAGIGPLPTFLAAGLPCAAVAAIAARWLPVDSGAVGGTGPARRPGPAQAAREAAGAGAPSRSRSGMVILLLGLIGLCALVGEGAAGDWSAVYLRDSLGTSAGFAAAGFAAFSITMTAGRLLGDRLVARFGPVRLVRGCGLLAAAGLAGGLISRDPLGAAAGFAVLGAGLSCIVPQVFSAGGKADPVRPGRGLARVVGLSYLGLVAGPVVIGACASVVGLPLALGIPVLLALGVAAFAWALGIPR